jgi:hypothetical protein
MQIPANALQQERPVEDGALEHFQEKWNPVFRPKVRAKKS